MSDPLNRLAKWRGWFAGWQLGTRPKGDPESDAVRDHRENTILMRVEINALVGLLVDKKVFTAEEWTRRLNEEAAWYDTMLEKRFPGVRSTDTGLVFTQEAAETQRKMNFKP
jgi:hypothetical protein